MKPRRAITFGVLAAIAGVMVTLWPRGPRIPALLAGSIPGDCQQVVLVLSPFAESVQARLWLMERAGDTGARFAVHWPSRLGHKGLAWGAGEHRVAMPAGFRVKHEGDKCSPAGVFAFRLRSARLPRVRPPGSSWTTRR